jgi:hypothetical protein
MVTEDEGVLIARSRSGDWEAFAALIRMHQRMIHSLAYRMSGSARKAAPHGNLDKPDRDGHNLLGRGPSAHGPGSPPNPSMNAHTFFPEPRSPAGFAGEGAGMHLRSALAAALALGLAGCVSTADVSKMPLPVSVSAANYSQLSDAELFSRVNNDSVNTRPEAPAVPKAAQPLFYLVLPGEIYPSDVSFDEINRELELALEPRGYFNAVYQMRMGRTPARIDYLLRVHYGERLWLKPTVRADRVTWGNDGIMAKRYVISLGSNDQFDPRAGLNPEEESAIRRLLAMPKISPSKYGSGENPADLNANEHETRDFGMGMQAAVDYCMVIVEAFKLDDVKAMDRKAPCTWATFIAVQNDWNRKFSDILRTMVQTATPYFGSTTSGLQLYEIPQGKVLVGTPVEVSGQQKAPAANPLSSPAVQFRPP